MAEKKTIYLSEDLILSIFFGVFTGVVIVFITHFYGNWSTWPENSSFGSSHFDPSPVRVHLSEKAAEYYLQCPLHQTHKFKGNGATIGDVIDKGFSHAKFHAIVASTFDGHYGHIFLYSLIATLVIYFFKKYSFGIKKE